MHDVWVFTEIIVHTIFAYYSQYMDECTCWLHLNSVSHVVIILILCFTAHTTLSPSSLYDNDITDGSIDELCSLIRSVKPLTDLWSVPPQLYSMPISAVLCMGLHVCMWHSAVHTDPLHLMAHNVVCVVWWSGSAYTTCALVMSEVSATHCTILLSQAIWQPVQCEWEGKTA